MSDIFDEVENELLLREIFGEDVELLEERTVFKSPKISLLVNPDRGGRLASLPYFKIIDGSSIQNATKIARIAFSDHHYIIHEDSLKHWELSTHDIKVINSILVITTEDNKTVYEKLLEEAAYNCNCNNIKEFVRKYKVSMNADISDVHYKSEYDRKKAKEKGI